MWIAHKSGLTQVTREQGSPFLISLFSCHKVHRLSKETDKWPMLLVASLSSNKQDTSGEFLNPTQRISVTVIITMVESKEQYWIHTNTSQFEIHLYSWGSRFSYMNSNEKARDEKKNLKFLGWNYLLSTTFLYTPHSQSRIHKQLN